MIPNPLPDQIKLPTPTLKLSLLFGLGALVFVGGLLAQPGAHPAAWIAVASGAALGALLLLALVRGIGLSLDRQGFSVRSPWGEQRHEWRDVSAFEVRMAGKARQIRFQDTTRGPDVRDPFNKALRRGNSRISPLVVSGGLQNACDLLNAFRERALK